MNQRTSASRAELQKYGRKSRRELFLDEMERIVPWTGLPGLIRPHYAKAGSGRRPVGLESMPRVYFVLQWFNLSDRGVEEALYESPALQRFVGVELGAAPAPDETTILRFRHLLEKHDLCGLMLEAVSLPLEAKGIKIATCTIVDATILHAPSSTKRRSGALQLERCGCGHCECDRRWLSLLLDLLHSCERGQPRQASHHPRQPRSANDAPCLQEWIF
jgi:IS5 family transposase